MNKKHKYNYRWTLADANFTNSVGKVCCISSFPQDYNFAGQSPHYVCGMSVPPIMMAQIANQIYEQWLKKQLKLQ